MFQGLNQQSKNDEQTKTNQNIIRNQANTVKN